jgi:integrase
MATRLESVALMLSACEGRTISRLARRRRGASTLRQASSTWALHAVVLRRTHATQPLKAGVHPKVVSERLGHASIGITLDTYGHVMPGMREEAAEKIDAGLRAALAG